MYRSPSVTTLFILPPTPAESDAAAAPAHPPPSPREFKRMLRVPVVSLHSLIELDSSVMEEETEG